MPIDSQVGLPNLRLGPQTRIPITNRSPGAMGGHGGQNPASSSPGWTGEVVGSDEGLTAISFWGLDGVETWPAGVGGGRAAGRPLRFESPARLRLGRATGDSEGSCLS
jgi:hypothetical protein